MPYYRDDQGKFLGWHSKPPAGAQIVPTAPADGRARWVADHWIEPEPEPEPVPIAALILRVLAAVPAHEIKVRLDLAMAQMSAEERAYAQEQLRSLRESVDPRDPVARNLLAALGLDPDDILR